MVAAGARPGEIAREFYQNRSLASIELEGRTVSHMCLSGDGEAVLSWLSLADFARVRCREGRCRAHDRSSALLARRARCLHAAGAGRRGARQLPFQGRHRRGRIAGEFGGGGHKAAAGFTIHDDLRGAVETVARRLGIESPTLPEERL